MGKKIEVGCMAVVVFAFNSSNIGKIVTVGKFIGDSPGFFQSNLWEVNQPMECGDGSYCQFCPEENMDRIDDEGTVQQIESSKSITV